MTTINPADWAILLLALGGDPPRERARDQQADRAGANLRMVMLHRLVALDPDSEQVAEALTTIVQELGDPTGPSRAMASSLFQEWVDGQSSPGYWPWLVAEAIETGAIDPSQRRKRRRAEADG